MNERTQALIKEFGTPQPLLHDFAPKYLGCSNKYYINQKARNGEYKFAFKPSQSNKVKWRVSIEQYVDATGG